MHPFFRPRRALASAPDQTPYQRAGQVWDDRMGLSLAHARNWRRIALANLVLAGFLGAGWWVQADRAVVKPFVVEVSDWGETQRIITFDADLQVDEAPVLFVIAPDGEAQMVNYRQVGGLYVVDRVFDRAELRLGDRRPQVVRIRRLAGAGS